jgi:hypothetical protein
VTRLALFAAIALAMGAGGCGLQELVEEYDGGGGNLECAAVLFEKRASFTTQSVEPEEVLSLQLPGDKAPHGWVVLLSARITSQAPQVASQEVRFLIDGVERGRGQSRSENDAPAGGGGPWQSFDWLPPSGDHVLSVEFRSTRDQFLATIEDLHVVAFPVPDGADLVFLDEPERRTMHQPRVDKRIYQDAASLEIAPAAPGDYLVLLGLTTTEAPGIASVGVRAVAPGADLWPVESDDPTSPRPHLCTNIDEWQSFLLLRSISTDGSPVTIDLQVDASGPGDTDPAEGSQIEHVRGLAMRHDAFAAVATAEVPDEQILQSPGEVVVGELELAAGDPCHGRVIAQFATLHAVGLRNARFDGAGAGFEHEMAADEVKLTYGSFAAVPAEEATRLTTVAWGGSRLSPLYVRESVIVGLDLAGMK